MEILFAPASPAFCQQFVSLVLVCLSELGRPVILGVWTFEVLQPHLLFLIQLIQYVIFEELVVIATIGSTPAANDLFKVGLCRLFFLDV